MKRQSYLIVVLLACCCIAVLAATGCKKAATTTAASYAIAAIADQSIEQGSSTTTTCTVTGTGTQPQVTVAVSGLPEGVTATVYPAVGLPTFNATIVFTATATAATGTYTYTVTASSPGFGSKTYSSHITVTTAQQCAAGLVGWYAEHNGSDTIKVTQVSGAANRIYIASQLPGNYIDYYADVYCSRDSLGIQPQVMGTNGDVAILSGNGSFTYNTLTISQYFTTDGFQSGPNTRTYVKY